MREPRRQWIVSGVIVSVLLVVPMLAWVTLTYQPRFYRRATAGLPREQLQAEAKRFAAQTLQLRNDICNEPTWQAEFTDQEVNAWLARDLVAHFADQLPPQVHDPRVAFEPDRVVLAFGLDRGPIRAIVSVVARVRVPEENLVALTVEKIRAGALPLDADAFLERIAAHARDRGLDFRWVRDGDNQPMALIRYRANRGRTDVVLERLRIRDGLIYLSGRSGRGRGSIASPTLPRRKVLQSNFPRTRNVHSVAPASPVRRSSTSPQI